MWKLFLFIIILEIIVNFSMKDTMKCITAHPEIMLKLILHHIFNCFLLYGY